MKKPLLAALLSFNGGFVDTAGFIGLQGLFTAHVTGNFVTLGAALVFGTKGVIAKLIALPEFICVIAAVRLAANALTAYQLPALRLFLVLKACLLLAFLLVAVKFGPFDDSDAPTALLAGFFGIAAMAIQNAVQRLHLSNLPPTTIMTGNTTQVTLDGIDLLMVTSKEQRSIISIRFQRILRGIVVFAAGCAAAAALYAWIGFWCLGLPLALAVLTAITSAED